MRARAVQIRAGSIDLISWQRKALNEQPIGFSRAAASAGQRNPNLWLPPRPPGILREEPAPESLRLDARGQDLSRTAVYVAAAVPEAQSRPGYFVWLNSMNTRGPRGVSN